MHSLAIMCPCTHVKCAVFLAGNNPPISEVIETGCIPKFIELLSHSDPQLQVCL